MKSFLDTLIQKMFLQIMKINNFRSDLTDFSASEEPLGTTGCIYTSLPPARLTIEFCQLAEDGTLLISSSVPQLIATVSMHVSPQ